MDKQQTHVDRLKQLISINSIVAIPVTVASIEICRVTKLSPKMVILTSLETNATYRKYPSEIIVLDKMEETLIFLLSRGL